MSSSTYINLSRFEKAFQYHQEYQYTYFITITTNYKYGDTTPIIQKFKKYAYHHDENSHLISVKETTTISKGLHYHVLYFTNKRLKYAKFNKHMPPHSDINIQLVPKTKSDIRNVVKYMQKSKTQNNQNI